MPYFYPRNIFGYAIIRVQEWDPVADLALSSCRNADYSTNKISRFTRLSLICGNLRCLLGIFTSARALA